MKDVWKYVTTKKKLYGETELDKHVMAVNKKWHKSKGNHKPDIKKNKDGSANLADTIRHEIFHKQHPKAHEKTVRKMTRKWMKQAGKKKKAKLYSLFKGK